MEKRVLHIALAIVTVVIFLTAFKGMSGAVETGDGDNLEGGGDGVTPTGGNSTGDGECDGGEELAFTDGNSGTIDIPMVGAQFTETDVKHHFEMPAGATKVKVTFTWDPKWELEASIGTGTCPHSGEMLEAETTSSGEVTLEYEDEAGLTEGQWFAHFSVPDVNAHRGESCSYTISAELCTCGGECGDDCGTC